MTYSELVSAITSYTQNYETEFLESLPVFVQQAEKRIYNSVQIPALRRNQTGVLVGGNKYLSAPSDFLSVFSLAVIEGYDTGNPTYTYLLNKDVNYIREAYPSPLDTGVPKYYALFGATTTPSLQITNELSFILGPTPDAAYSVEMHYYYYPVSIVQGIINLFNSSYVGGTGYANGNYFNVPLTGGSGSGATANITVTGGVVTEVIITSGGSLYVVGDQLSASQASLGVGSGFLVTVSEVTNTTGTSWLGDNYDPVLLYASLVEAYTFMKGEADIMAFYDKKYQDALAQLNRLGTGLERGDAYRDGQAKIKVNP
jgi:hypothetical protein